MAAGARLAAACAPAAVSGPLRAKMGPGVEVIMRPPPRETRLAALAKLV
jgi:hypothetical protein